MTGNDLFSVSHLHASGIFRRESAERHYVPNPGFLQDMVMGDPAAAESGEDVAAASTAPQTSTTDEDESADACNFMSSKETASTSVTDAKNDTQGQLVGSMDELKEADDVSAIEQRTLSTEEVDALLGKCLLQALHSTVKEKDLPIPGSTLW